MKNRISFVVNMMSFLSLKVISKGSYSAESQGKNSVQRETIMLRQTMTLATATFLSLVLKLLIFDDWIVGELESNPR